MGRRWWLRFAVSAAVGAMIGNINPATAATMQVAGAECMPQSLGSGTTTIVPGGMLTYVGAGMSFVCPFESRSSSLPHEAVQTLGVYVSDPNYLSPTWSAGAQACVQNQFSTSAVCGTATLNTWGAGDGWLTVNVSVWASHPASSSWTPYILVGVPGGTGTEIIYGWATA